MVIRKKLKNQIIIVMIIVIVIFSIIYTTSEKKTYMDKYVDNAKIQYSKEYLEWEGLSEEEKKNTLKPREEYIALEEVYRKEVITLANEQTEGDYKYKSSEIPESFNLKDKIGEIKVENQELYNTCYVYATLNAVETNLALRTGNMYDFSEMHVEYMTSTLFGGNRQLGSGGNFHTVTNYLAKGYGPVLESDVPTKIYTEEEYSILTNAIQIARATYATAFSTIDKKNKNYTEAELAIVRNAVKDHVMNDSSVFAGLYLEENTNYYNSDTYAYCCLDGNMQMNHAVSIVGWNDNYPKENFPEKNRPNNDGAYIALNSWGEDWGDNGYFYISYEDIWIEYNLSGIAETEELGPEIEFSGYSKTLNKISMDVNVTDKGKSGIDETSLNYVWKNRGEVPEKCEFVNSFVNGERISIDTSQDLTLWVLAKNNKGITTIDEEEIILEAGPWNISSTGNDNVIAKFYSDGTLTIDGIGNMLDWNDMNEIPWINNRKEIIKVIIEEGITNIGNKAFYSNYVDYGIKEVKMSDTIQRIGQYSFSGCKQIEEIYITDSVQVIDKAAFRLCENLESVILGNDIQRIEEMAFAFCKNLKMINLPEGLKYIGLEALRNCTVDEIIIPSTVEEIKPRTFIGAKSITVNEGNLYYSSREGHLFNKDQTILIEYASGNTSTEYSVPNTVTQISNYCFFDCENLITITMKDNIKNIETSAFENCTKLENLQLSNQIQSIPCYMIQNCTSIKKIEIPEGVTKIGMNAFSKCTSLEEVSIGKNVYIIEEDVFEKCGNLKEIKVAEGNVFYASDQGILFNKNMTRLILCPARNQLEEYTIPESVVSIENSAFYNNENLKTITLSDKLVTIGDYAFENCVNLIRINNISNAEKIGIYAFSKCYLLTDVGNMVNLKSLGRQAFKECSSLTTIELPEGLTKLESETFYKCTNLKNIKLPNTITSIGHYTFSYTAIEEIELPENLLELGCSFSGCSKLKEVVVPNTLTEIQPFTFENCSSLINVEIPNTIKKIGSSAFYGCSSIKNIEIPEGIEIIGNYAFGSCSSIENIEIPDTVKEIDYDAFDSCYSLKNVKLSKNLKVSGKHIFYECTMLENVIIPSGIEEIPNGMFAYCTKLETINIPNTVKTIEEGAFYECTGLLEVTIPEGVEKLGKGAFYHCENLNKITIPDTVTTIIEYNFIGSKNLTIYCKEGSTAQKYAADNNINYVLIPDGCINHVEIIDVAVEPTCTEAGLTEGKHCSECGKIIEKQEEIPALGHDYKEKVTEPRCEEEGYTTQTCTKCKDSYIDTYTDALGHSFKNYTSDGNATCTKDGTKTAKCNRCEEKDTKIDVGSILPHTEVIDKGKAATCTTKGLTEGKHCETCKTVIGEQKEISALGHNYEEKVTSPKCSEKGYTTHICTRCEHSYINEESYTDALGHSFTNYTSDGNATCTQDGTKTGTCERCGTTDTQTDVGSKIPHREVIDKGKPATCTEKGLTEGKHCEICKTVLVEQKEISALGHNYEEKVTSPKCSEKGYTSHTCTKCKDSYIDTYTDALGHSFTNYTSDENATCTQDGTKTAKCDRCDVRDTQTDVGSKIPHNYVNQECTMCKQKEPKIEITSEKFKIENQYISQIEPKTTIKDLKENISTNATEVKIYDKDQIIQHENETLKTGMQLELNWENEKETYIIVVNGDLNCDGKANILDMVVMNRHRLNKKILEGEYLIAGDITSDNKIDILDIVKINKYRLSKITQILENIIK